MQTRRNVTERATVHGRLIDAAASLLPAQDNDARAPWWLLPATPVTCGAICPIISTRPAESTSWPTWSATCGG
jgi:hypothetical protein